MSSIASLIKVPKSALDGLRDAAAPKKRWFGKPKDLYWGYLETHGREVVQFRWSGYILVVLLLYLEELHQMNFEESEFEELADFLAKSRGSTHYIFAPTHRRDYFDKLEPALFSEEKLRDYFNEFNETDEPEVGHAMLDGVRAVQQGLGALDDESVIVLSIG